MENINGDKYIKFKRKVYLTIIPLFFLTNNVHWFFMEQVDQIMTFIIPLLSIYLGLIWLFMIWNRFIRIIEIISLIIFTLYHLYRVLLMASSLELGTVDVYVFWSINYYIFIFLVLERMRALVFSLVIFFFTISIVIPFGNIEIVNEALIQYYISTLIYIFVMFYFQKLVSTYLEWDILRKIAYYDSLTGIGNRRLVDTWLENEVTKSYDSNNPFSIIYFDIDHFKRINDQYGHDVGDQVLKEFTSLIENYIHPDDLFGRWGGEEFVILSKNSTLSEATELAENLRNTIENHPFRYVNHITTSFGVSSFRFNDMPKTLMKRADQALYLAKNNGRNKVIPL